MCARHRAAKRSSLKRRGDIVDGAMQANNVALLSLVARWLVAVTFVGRAESGGVTAVA